jgi:hypothetical protein
MREVLGLKRTFVTTIEEEQDLSDFLTLIDYVSSLKMSWDTQRAAFDRKGLVQPFLGTQLVLVSRELAVIAESVQEVYFAMDSVFLGAAERQTIRLVPTDGSSPIFVSELLDWADRFASDEGPRLILDAGKLGVQAFFPTIERLRKLVRDSLIPPQDAKRLPDAYATSRVQSALEELTVHLDNTAALVRPFLSNGKPAVKAVNFFVNGQSTHGAAF